MKEDRINPFDPYGDPEKTGLKWRDWKRSFMYYLDSKDEMTEARKLAKLMHFAGKDVQVIYEQEKAKSEDAESDGEVVSDFVEALRLLDVVFLKQNNEPFQRSVFRRLEQKPEESTAAFVVRLREQASFCNFGSSAAMEKAIKDQIISGGRLEKLRREMLKEDKPLEEVVKQAQAIENVEQFEKANKRQPETLVNEVTTKRLKPDMEPLRQKPNTNNTSAGACWACNREGHRRGDPACAARNKKCLKCNRMGHFSIVCRSQTRGRRPLNRVRAVEEEQENDEVEYVFQVGKPKGTVKCRVGGVEIDVLIDSGTRRNLITEDIWKTMKERKVQTLDMVKGSDVSFKAYGQNQLIPVVGRFKALLSLNGKESTQWFYVVKQGDVCLLGEETSIEHGVLKVVRAVDSSEFPKIKGNWSD